MKTVLFHWDDGGKFWRLNRNYHVCECCGYCIEANSQPITEAEKAEIALGFTSWAEIKNHVEKQKAA